MSSVDDVDDNWKQLYALRLAFAMFTVGQVIVLGTLVAVAYGIQFTDQLYELAWWGLFTIAAAGYFAIAAPALATRFASLVESYRGRSGGAD